MKNILVIDDEKIIIDVLNRMLVRLGYNTVATDSWRSGLREFFDNKFDLIMLDVMMPGRNGLDIAHEMLGAHPDQKVVMITGCGSNAVYNHMSSIGMDAIEVLFKPFTFEKVRSVITRILSNNESCYA